jgi:hypothetical protein
MNLDSGAIQRSQWRSELFNECKGLLKKCTGFASQILEGLHVCQEYKRMIQIMQMYHAAFMFINLTVVIFLLDTTFGQRTSYRLPFLPTFFYFNDLSKMFYWNAVAL